ncbi:MAG: hypothetical protein HPY53_14510 [Brevinematales bacterium]|nr:hypothetical protein [Brevinematales bacterium]
MKKLFITLSAFIVMGWITGCSDALSNDKIAQYVASSAGANSSAMQMVSYSKFKALSSLANTGLSPLTVTNNNADGSVTYIDTFSGITFTTTIWPLTFNNDYARMKFNMGFDFGTDNGSMSMGSDISIRFYDTNGVVIHITNESGYSDADAVAGIVDIFGAISISTTDKDGKTFSFTGQFGDSLDKPFQFNANANSLNGSISYTITGTDLGEAVTIYYDYKNLTAGSLAEYPSGTVNGYAQQGTTKVDFTIVFNGTSTATLTVGGKNYIIDLATKTYADA